MSTPGRGTLAPSFVDLHVLVLVLRFVSFFVAYLGISFDSQGGETGLFACGW